MLRRELVVAAVLVGCRRHDATPPPGVIHHTSGAIAIDGDWDEPDWPTHAFRGQFVGADGELARPSSEIRLLHDDRELFVALYAADDDIESRDAFELSIGAITLRVDATGAVTPPNAAIRAKVGFDEGTIDHPQDDDEEWVVELAIPLASVGLAAGVRQEVRASRCDTPKGDVERCGHWSGSVTID